MWAKASPGRWTTCSSMARETRKLEPSSSGAAATSRSKVGLPHDTKPSGASRLGQGSRVVLTHDVAQRDNLRVGRREVVAAVIEPLKGHPLFAHITLTRSERSPIAALVTEMLEELPL